VQKYLGKLSGPLLDRIDLHVAVSRVSFDELVQRGPAETSAAIRARVEAARKRQSSRLHGTGLPKRRPQPRQRDCVKHECMLALAFSRERGASA
jgi:magnesium chelatase family protein